MKPTKAAGKGSYRHAVIITAAGSSVRFNESLGADGCGRISKADSSASTDDMVKKEFLEIDGIPILARSLVPFLSVPGLAAVVVTYRNGFENETKECLGCIINGGEECGKGVKVHFVEGGDTRQKSVFNALSFLKSLYDEGLGIDLVSIHDGARPFVSSSTIEACLEAAAVFGGAAPCVPVSDTLVKVDDGLVCGGIDRTGVYGVQTPQVFSFPGIHDAHVQAARLEGVAFTDDTQIFTTFGGRVAAVPGDPRNRKITFKDDLIGVCND